MRYSVIVMILSLLIGGCSDGGAFGTIDCRLPTDTTIEATRKECRRVVILVEAAYDGKMLQEGILQVNVEPKVRLSPHDHPSYSVIIEYTDESSAGFCCDRQDMRHVSVDGLSKCWPAPAAEPARDKTGRLIIQSYPPE